MTYRYTSLINFGLRGLTSLSKFLLTLVLASQFDFFVLGEYSLVVNALLITTFFIGFEVYQYTSRSIITNPEDKPELIQQHFLFILTSFLYLSPLFLLFFIFDALSINYIIPLYILLLLELVSNEQYRLLIALKHPIFANVVFFVRTSLWIYLFVAYLQFDQTVSNPLLMIIVFWILGAIISLLIPFVYFRIYENFWNNLTQLPTIPVIVGFWKKSYVLFFASVALMLINTIDKFVIDFFVGKTVLGVYALFFSLSSVIFIFVLAGVISITYPHLLEAYKKDKNRYDSELKRFSKRLIYSSLLMGLISVFILFAYLYNIQATDKYNFLIEYMSTYVLLLVSFIIYTLHMKFHYELYAANMDAQVMKSNYLMLIVYVLTLIPFTYLYSIFGTACAHLIASLTVLGSKHYYVKKSFIKEIA